MKEAHGFALASEKKPELGTTQTPVTNKTPTTKTCGSECGMKSRHQEPRQALPLTALRGP